MGVDELGEHEPVCRAQGQETCVTGSRTPLPLGPGDTKTWVPSSVLLTSICSFFAAVQGNPTIAVSGIQKV